MPLPRLHTAARSKIVADDVTDMDNDASHKRPDRLWERLGAARPSFDWSAELEAPTSVTGRRDEDVMAHGRCLIKINNSVNNARAEME